METVKEKQKKAYLEMKDEFGYTNIMSAPRLTKILVNVGTGKRSRTDRHYNDLVADRLAKITGQKPAIRGAKKSIATFKIRTGDPVGQMVTLRGQRMYTFFDKLVNIALPRTKDFRGIKRSAVDEMGNLTIGIKEHAIFPETSEEDIRDIFGLSIVIGTSATSKEEAFRFLEKIGIPFAKEKVAK